MKRIAVIGAGVSGLTIAQCMKMNAKVTVFEQNEKPGGLIRCDVVDGNLYHKVGGHVFNSQRKDVLEWFWKFFDRDTEFVKTFRNACIILPDGKTVGYPIESHAYLLDEGILNSFIDDLVSIIKDQSTEYLNFEEFLKSRFGETLYQLYFKPYNEKVWKRDLSKIPISWLEGKLPMPTAKDMISNNIKREQDISMVHSSFYYANKGGSQFLANRLAEGLEVLYNAPVVSIVYDEQKHSWIVNDSFEFDLAFFCGNIIELSHIFRHSTIDKFKNSIDKLEFHGTTSVLCYIEKNPYSWVYLPDSSYASHRVLCTGNFSMNNNNFNDKLTGTIEFTDEISYDEILVTLKKMPFSPQYIQHSFTKFTYPIQSVETRKIIDSIKLELEPMGFYLLGRFAEWEYYNMDTAIGAALDLCDRIEIESSL